MNIRSSRCGSIVDVTTLCAKYRRKIWQSMISRTKLNFTIWDAILTANETVIWDTDGITSSIDKISNIIEGKYES